MVQRDPVPADQIVLPCRARATVVDEDLLRRTLGHQPLERGNQRPVLTAGERVERYDEQRLKRNALGQSDAGITCLTSHYGQAGGQRNDQYGDYGQDRPAGDRRSRHRRAPILGTVVRWRCTTSSPVRRHDGVQDFRARSPAQVANGQRSLGRAPTFQWFRGSLERRSQQGGPTRERASVGSKSRTGTCRGAFSQVVRCGHRDSVGDPVTSGNARQLGSIDLLTSQDSFDAAAEWAGRACPDRGRTGDDD